MTKDVNVLTVLISLFVIFSLLFFSFYIKDKTADLSTTSYNARKEDLQLKQAELENIILNLNNTLQEEKLKQQALANQLSLDNQALSNPPTPPPKQNTVPVTRAS